jgi:hypothetical protein
VSDLPGVANALPASVVSFLASASLSFSRSSTEVVTPSLNRRRTATCHSSPSFVSLMPVGPDLAVEGIPVNSKSLAVIEILLKPHLSVTNVSTFASAALISSESKRSKFPVAKASWAIRTMVSTASPTSACRWCSNSARSGVNSSRAFASCAGEAFPSSPPGAPEGDPLGSADGSPEASAEGSAEASGEAVAALVTASSIAIEDALYAGLAAADGSLSGSRVDSSESSSTGAPVAAALGSPDGAAAGSSSSSSPNCEPAVSRATTVEQKPASVPGVGVGLGVALGEAALPGVVSEPQAVSAANAATAATAEASRRRRSLVMVMRPLKVRWVVPRALFRPRRRGRPAWRGNNRSWISFGP